MADITKCVGTDCSVKEMCYRYTAPVNDFRQSWLYECPLKEDGSCDMYWGENQENILNQLKNIVNGKTK